MPEPRFLTQWEREDYEREKRGEAPLGPFGRKGANAPEPTQEQIEAAARAIWQTLFPHLPYQTGCSAAAQAALKAAAALSPEQQPTDTSYAEVSTDDIKRMNEYAKDAAYTPEKRREE